MIHLHRYSIPITEVLRMTDPNSPKEYVMGLYECRRCKKVKVKVNLTTRPLDPMQVEHIHADGSVHTH